MFAKNPKNQYKIDYIEHQFNVYGLSVNGIKIVYSPSHINETKLNNTQSAILLMQPKREQFEKFGIRISIQENPPLTLNTSFIENNHKSWSFRTLHPYYAYSIDPHVSSKSYVEDHKGNKVWFSFTHNQREYIVIGTDLAEDLILFRQGDPLQVKSATIKTAWGFDFERPMYLYDNLIDKSNLLARPVDSWMLLLKKILHTQHKIPMRPMLPNNAKGAIILTGDDDQAYLESYEKQLKHIGQTPITYFMHHKTRVTRKFLKQFSATNHIELGLHPDAVYTPNKYKYLCIKQSIWFRRKFLQQPFSVRNHCYLNKGYWGHLSAWKTSGLKFSSNIPGKDGSILTGSLIPSKVVMNNVVTNHWSILTALGDGMIYSDDYIDETAARKIQDFANQILLSDMSGVIAVNLHPQNFDQTVKMHDAILEIIKNGFHPFTMKECLNWFNRRSELAI